MVLLFLVFLPNPGAYAQTMTEQQGAAPSASGMPERWLLKSEVESQFGAPIIKSQGVGEPVITFWEYNEYLVYFEYDRVLHAFAKRD
jgi:hypothetical protein